MSNQYPLRDIVIFDDDEEDLQPKPNQGRRPEIVVFDDEECLESDKEDLQESNHFKKHEGEDKQLSTEEYRNRLSEIQDRIILSSLTNLKRGSQKIEQKSIQDNKKKRNTLEDALNFQKRNSKTFNELVFEPKSVNVRVNFGQQQKVETFKPQFFRAKQTIHNFGDPLNDQIVDENQLKRSPVKKSKLNGACLERRVDLKIEQDKNKNLLKVSNFREFLYTQLKANYSIYLKIKRTENGLINSTYKIYFQDNNKFIMACQKQGFSKYIFSNSQIHISEDHISFLGKMQSNFFGTEFQMYDSGQEWTKTKMMQNYKKQLASIQYTQDEDRPRSISALITTCDNKSTDFTILDKTDNVVQKRWEKNNNKNISKFVSKDPSFDPIDCNYKLDFRGMAGVPSIKNFILENQTYPDAIIFGRQDKETYIMKIKAPFSIMQALAIAMSSIHHKFL